jgi:COP9 signalosome complex subunit 1
VDRLVYIINICPSLAAPALQLAAQHIFKTRDIDLYRNTASVYDAVAANAQLPLAAEVAPLDQAWYDEWTSKNLAERSRLEVELKTYTSNMIKESIRVRSTAAGGSTTIDDAYHRWLTETWVNFTYP